MRHGYTLKQIADHLRLHYTTVSKTVKALEIEKLISQDLTPICDQNERQLKSVDNGRKERSESKTP
jgi:DNA-binding transcriptional regulator YhcF (GntR family)